MSNDLLRGYTDAILLCQLSQGDSYGYQIQKAVAKLSGGILEMKEATLYTAFKRMEQAGLIRSYWGNEQQGARRRYYAITEDGRSKLKEEQSQWQETKEILTRLMGTKEEVTYDESDS